MINFECKVQESFCLEISMLVVSRQKVDSNFLTLDSITNLPAGFEVFVIAWSFWQNILWVRELYSSTGKPKVSWNFRLCIFSWRKHAENCVAEFVREICHRIFTLLFYLVKFWKTAVGLLQEWNQVEEIRNLNLAW